MSALAAGYAPGSTVYAKKRADRCFTVPRVVDWTAFAVDMNPSPSTSGNTPNGARVLPQLAATDIAVTVIQV